MLLTKWLFSSHTFRIISQLPVRSFGMASTFPPSSIRDLASEVSSLLKERSETVCVAETVRRT